MEHHPLPSPKAYSFGPKHWDCLIHRLSTSHRSAPGAWKGGSLLKRETEGGAQFSALGHNLKNSIIFHF